MNRKWQFWAGKEINVINLECLPLAIVKMHDCEVVKLQAWKMKSKEIFFLIKYPTICVVICRVFLRGWIISDLIQVIGFSKPIVKITAHMHSILLFTFFSWITRTTV